MKQSLPLASGILDRIDGPKAVDRWYTGSDHDIAFTVINIAWVVLTIKLARV